MRTRSAIVHRVFACALAALFVLMASQGGVNARTWYVNVQGTGDVPTIQAAVDSVTDGDVILVAAGRYTWTNQNTISDYAMVHIPRGKNNFILKSESGPDATILDGEYQGRVMFIAGFNYITVDGFTITRGQAPVYSNETGGGIAAHLTYDTIRNCIIRNNFAVQGGGVWIGGVSSITFESCEFSGNTAAHGGAIFYVNSSMTPTLRDCVIRGNTATDRGGGIRTVNNPVLIENTLIVNNTATNEGGAMYLDRSYNTLITNSTIVYNDAGITAGIHVVGTSTVTVASSIIAKQYGTALGLDNAFLTVTCSDIWGNANNALPAGTVDGGANFGLDPQFCGTGVSQDFMLNATSPCLPGAHPNGASCGMVGAGGQGCGSVPTRTMTWGAVKGLYR